MGHGLGSPCRRHGRGTTEPTGAEAPAQASATQTPTGTHGPPKTPSQAGARASHVGLYRPQARTPAAPLVLRRDAAVTGQQGLAKQVRGQGCQGQRVGRGQSCCESEIMAVMDFMVDIGCYKGTNCIFVFMEERTRT